MTVTITIIGLGKIGTSVGLALGARSDQLRRLGHDRVPEMARRAQKLGAVDKVVYNLPSSVSEADIVFLALPIDQIKETLELIGPDLKEGAVVMDTAPVKAIVAEWSKEFIPANRYYVGLTPVINSEHLHMVETGTDGGREDLFENGIMGIVAPSGTASSAIKLAADLTSLLGSKPLFMDMVEVDSLMAASHIVPQLLAAGLVDATSSQPGWQEGRKVAGAGYAQVSSALNTLDGPEALSALSASSQEHVLRVLNNVLISLISIRDSISDGDAEGLEKRLSSAHAAHKDWWEQRQLGEWQDGIPTPDLPTSGQELRRWFVGQRKDR